MIDSFIEQVTEAGWTVTETSTRRICFGWSPGNHTVAVLTGPHPDQRASVHFDEETGEYLEAELRNCGEGTIGTESATVIAMRYAAGTS